MSLLDLLDKVRAEMPGCQLTSVVDRESGLSLATSSTVEPHDAAAVDAFDSELHRLLGAALSESGVDGPLDDLVLQGHTHAVVATRLGDTGYFWHVATASETTLGFTQAVMRKYHEQVIEGLEALLG